MVGTQTTKQDPASNASPRLNALDHPSGAGLTVEGLDDGEVFSATKFAGF